MKIIVLASAVFLLFFFACAQPKEDGPYVPPKDNGPSGPDEGNVCAQPLGTSASKRVAGIKGAKAIFYSGEGPTVIAGHSSDSPIEPTPTPGSEGDEGDEGGVVVLPTDTPEPPGTVPEPTYTDTKTEPIVTNAGSGGKTEEYWGIEYWITLVDSSGSMERVTPSRVFTSGERIKLNIQTNKDGYLYVMNVGSTGNSHVLFPNSGVSSNFVKARTPYEVPYGAYMRFDENPGEELLLVMLSPEPMDYLPFEPSIERPLDNQETQSVVQVAQAKGSKDIVLENDTGVQPGTYVVAPMSSLEAKMVALKIKLCHE